MKNGDEKLGFNKMKDIFYDNVYTEVRNGLLKYEKMIPLRTTPNIVNDAVGAILHDTPELFWFEGKWKAVAGEKQGKYMMPVYNMDREAVKIAQKQIEERFDTLDCICENCSEYEIARGVYRWILENVQYGLDVNNSGQNIYNALAEGRAVCKGIAKAYQFILSRYGIFSALAAGSLDGRMRHIWNVIRLDGGFYNVDICMGYERFDCLFSGKGRKDDLYRGFLLTDKQIECTHAWQPEYPYRIVC